MVKEECTVADAELDSWIRLIPIRLPLSQTAAAPQRSLPEGYAAAPHAEGRRLDKGEAGSQLQQERFELAQDSVLNIPLQVVIFQVKEIENVGIF